jgi:hypothetical protein
MFRKQPILFKLDLDVSRIVHVPVWGFHWVLAAVILIVSSASPGQGAQPRFLFSRPQLLDGISTPGENQSAATLTSDETEIIFEGKPAGSGQNRNGQMYSARRSTMTGAFGESVAMESLNTDCNEGQPSISSDGLTLYYEKNCPSPAEIWTATRRSRTESFGNPTLLFEPQPGWSLTRPSISADDLKLYVQYTDVGVPDANVYVSRRERTSEPWGELQPVPELSDPRVWQSRPFISADNLSLFFTQGDSAATRLGIADLAVIVRPSVDAPWSSPVNLGNAINTNQYEDFATLSASGQRLYFTRFDAAGTYDSGDIWHAAVLPFEAVSIRGEGGGYQQDFNSLGVDAASRDTDLPVGWTFTSNSR